MRIAIVGQRTFEDYPLLKETISPLNIDLIVSGGAIGADSLAEKFAKEFSIPISIYYAEWQKHGKIAGFLRNTEIVDNADKIYAFWDGKSKGTLDTINKAKKKNKNVVVIDFSENSLDI